MMVEAAEAEGQEEVAEREDHHHSPEPQSIEGTTVSMTGPATAQWKEPLTLNAGR
jgi:hypothetical protein